MTDLEKIKQLIQKNNVEVTFGTPNNNWQELCVGLSVTESPETRHYLSDKVGVAYRYIRILVYCTDYLAGYALMDEIKTKIDAAAKTTMHVVHVKDLDSTRDTAQAKFVLGTVYKEII